QFFGICGREEHGMRPAEAILELGRVPPFLIIGPGAEAAVLTDRRVVLQEDRKVTAAVGNVGIAGLRRDERALAVRHALPFIARDRSIYRCARAFNRAFVLLRAVDMKREAVVEGDVIELAGGLFVLAAPGLAAVGRD